MTRATETSAASGDAAAPPRKAAPRKPRAPKAAAAKQAASKVSPAAKPTPAKKTAPAAITPAEPVPLVTTPDARSGHLTPPAPDAPATHRLPTPQRDTDRWAKLLADPAHTPELLALAAVETIGPRARHWASTTTAAYPTATRTGLVRLATRQFTRFGALTGVFGAVAGAYAALALVASRTLTEAELILHLAAAHGLDPTHPDRAVDLLVISGVHDTREEAGEALAAIDGPEPTASGLGDAVWRVGRLVVARSGGWSVLRAINRYIPGVGLVGAVLTSAADAQATGARATRYYSQFSQEAGSRS